MSRVLVEFKAGRLNLTNKKLVPVSTKGTVYFKETSPGEYLLEWFNRETNQTDYSITIKGKQAEFVKVPNAPGGRFYYFKFTDRSIKKPFFWLQDVSTDQDSNIEQIIRKSLDIAPPLPSVRQVAPPTTGAVQLSDLQQILSSLPAQPAAQPRLSRGPSLQQVLDSNVLETIIIGMSDEAVASLKEFMPPQHSTKQDILNLIRSPQFQQALERFNSMLHSEDLPSIFYQCGLKWNDNNLHGSVIASFFRALQKQASEAKKQ